MKRRADTAGLRRLALHAGLSALMLPAAGLRAQSQTDAWAALNAAQREALAPFQQEWNSWPEQERVIWRRLADQMPSFDENRRQQAMARIREWAALSPAQRSVARHNFRLAQSLNRDARVREWQRYRSMTPEQRSVLRAHPLVNNGVLPARSSQPLSLVPRRH